MSARHAYAEVQDSQPRRKVVLAGHFSVGLKATENERATIEDAIDEGGDLSVLANDMNFYRQALYYRKAGRQALVREVERRPKCGTTRDFYLAPDESSAPRIDFDIYDSIVQHFQSEDPDYDTFKRVLREEVVPKAIRTRLEHHGLSAQQVLLFTESRLRNFASSRIRRRRSGGAKSWRCNLKNANLLERVTAPVSRIPTCGAVLLGLYEQLATRGYDCVVHLFDQQDKPMIENGVSLLSTMAKNDQSCFGTGLRFERHYYASGNRIGSEYSTA